MSLCAHTFLLSWSSPALCHSVLSHYSERHNAVHIPILLKVILLIVSLLIVIQLNATLLIVVLKYLSLIKYNYAESQSV